jgi:hypothetical protein
MQYKTNKKFDFNVPESKYNIGEVLTSKIGTLLSQELIKLPIFQPRPPKRRVI